MATLDRWNIHGLDWLRSLENIKANIDPEDPMTRLTQFEENLLEQLKTMVQPQEELNAIEEKKREKVNMAFELLGSFFALVQEMSRGEDYDGFKFWDRVRELLESYEFWKEM